MDEELAKPALQRCSVREQQAFAAICFAVYCRENNIFHESIEEFVRHRIRMLACDSLPGWWEETRSHYLPYEGEGPDLLRKIVSPDIRDEFDELTEDVAYVGGVDMFGKLTSSPLEFAINCVDVLVRNNIELPNVELVTEELKNEPTPRWGNPSTQGFQESVLKAAQRILTREF